MTTKLRVTGLCAGNSPEPVRWDNPIWIIALGLRKWINNTLFAVNQCLHLVGIKRSCSQQSFVCNCSIYHEWEYRFTIHPIRYVHCFVMLYRSQYQSIAVVCDPCTYNIHCCLTGTGTIAGFTLKYMGPYRSTKQSKQNKPQQTLVHNLLYKHCFSIFEV